MHRLEYKVLLTMFALVLAGQIFAQNDAPQQIESTELAQTIITPVMEVPIVPGENIIYCSTFQLAWNMLQDSIIADSIRLEGNLDIVRLLNKQLSTTEDIEEECYVAMVDTLTVEFLDRINRTLKAKFGDDAPPEVKQDIHPLNPQILAYAYLFKGLEFPIEFDRMKYPLTFRLGDEYVSVTSFGVDAHSTGDRQNDVRRQVQIFDCRNEWEFVVGLNSALENDEIILAKIPPPATLFEAVMSTVYTVDSKTPTTLNFGQSLRVPVFDFNVKHSYKELVSKKFLNKDWKGWFISDAVQWIRFQMNERGVVLKSEAKIEMMLGIAQSFQFTPPFLLYLKQKNGRFPYFAVWVENAELMVKYER